MCAGIRSMTPARPGDYYSRILDVVLLSNKVESATTPPSLQA